jgi:hypothetical protein
MISHGILIKALTRQNNSVDLKDLPSLGNQPQVRKSATLIETFEILAIFKRMFRQQKLSFRILPLNHLPNLQSKSFIGVHRSLQFIEALGANWDRLSQIKVWKFWSYRAALAIFFIAAGTPKVSENGTTALHI